MTLWHNADEVPHMNNVLVIVTRPGKKMLGRWNYSLRMWEDFDGYYRDVVSWCDPLELLTSQIALESRVEELEEELSKQQDVKSRRKA